MSIIVDSEGTDSKNYRKNSPRRTMVSIRTQSSPSRNPINTFSEAENCRPLPQRVLTTGLTQTASPVRPSNLSSSSVSHRQIPPTPFNGNYEHDDFSSTSLPIRNNLEPKKQHRTVNNENGSRIHPHETPMPSSSTQNYVNNLMQSSDLYSYSRQDLLDLLTSVDPALSAGGQKKKINNTFNSTSSTLMTQASYHANLNVNLEDQTREASQHYFQSERQPNQELRSIQPHDSSNADYADEADEAADLPIMLAASSSPDLPTLVHSLSRSLSSSELRTKRLEGASHSVVSELQKAREEFATLLKAYNELETRRKHAEAQTQIWRDRCRLHEDDETRLRVEVLAGKEMELEQVKAELNLLKKQNKRNVEELAVRREEEAHLDQMTMSALSMMDILTRKLSAGSQIKYSSNASDELINERDQLKSTYNGKPIVEKISSLVSQCHSLAQLSSDQLILTESNTIRHQTQLSVQESELIVLRNQISLDKKKLDELHSDALFAKETIEALECKNKLLDDSCNRLKAALSESSQKLREASGRASTAENKVETVLFDLENLRIRVQGAREETFAMTAGLQAELEIVRGERMTALNEIDKMKKEMEGIKFSLKEKVKNVEDLSAKLHEECQNSMRMKLEHKDQIFDFQQQLELAREEIHKDSLERIVNQNSKKVEVEESLTKTSAEIFLSSKKIKNPYADIQFSNNEPTSLQILNTSINETTTSEFTPLNQIKSNLIVLPSISITPNNHDTDYHQINSVSLPQNEKLVPTVSVASSQVGIIHTDEAINKANFRLNNSPHNQQQRVSPNTRNFAQDINTEVVEKAIETTHYNLKNDDTIDFEYNRKGIDYPELVFFNTQKSTATQKGNKSPLRNSGSLIPWFHSPLRTTSTSKTQHYQGNKNQQNEDNDDGSASNSTRHDSGPNYKNKISSIGELVPTNSPSFVQAIISNSDLHKNHSLDASSNGITEEKIVSHVNKDLNPQFGSFDNHLHSPSNDGGIFSFASDSDHGLNLHSKHNKIIPNLATFRADIIQSQNRSIDLQLSSPSHSLEKHEIEVLTINSSPNSHFINPTSAYHRPDPNSKYNSSNNNNSNNIIQSHAFVTIETPGSTLQFHSASPTVSSSRSPNKPKGRSTTSTPEKKPQAIHSHSNISASLSHSPQFAEFSQAPWNFRKNLDSPSSNITKGKNGYINNDHSLTNKNKQVIKAVSPPLASTLISALVQKRQAVIKSVSPTHGGSGVYFEGHQDATDGKNTIKNTWISPVVKQNHNRASLNEEEDDDNHNNISEKNQLKPMFMSTETANYPIPISSSSSIQSSSDVRVVKKSDSIASSLLSAEVDSFKERLTKAQLAVQRATLQAQRLQQKKNAFS